MGVPAQQRPGPDVAQGAGVLSVVINQNDCLNCGGDLERGRYKGNAAAVCTDCGTPCAQIFEP